jgi:DNA-binding CsgD family transcriptional regulator
MTVYENQVITSTTSDSLGFFSFEGKLLSEKHALYRIHAEVEDGFGANQIHDNEDLKNLHNFIFSNTDTIVFQKNKKYWFSDNTNTNPVDKEWREFNNYGKQLRRELFSITESSIKKQSSIQYLNELKSYANSRDIHPLVSLILISSVDVNILKQDIKADPIFYNALQNSLRAYYGDSLYAKQFEELLTDLTKTETQRELEYFRKLVYGLGIVCVLLIALIVFLGFKIKRIKGENLQQASVNLTNQEERVAQLIQQEKSNKEIADELFISVSTVKTHIRNLYAKLEVSNRQEFTNKIKNQPRD